MDMARSLGHVDGGQEEALEALCRAAQAAVSYTHLTLPTTERV